MSMSKNIKHTLKFLFSPVVVNFKDIVNKHLYEKLSLKDYAALTGNSLTIFKTKFRKYYGQSPAKYIKEQKLKKAANLLKIPQSTVSEVAFECGFQSPEHFSRSFSSHYGVPPSKYVTE